MGSENPRRCSRPELIRPRLERVHLEVCPINGLNAGSRDEVGELFEGPIRSNGRRLYRLTGSSGCEPDLDSGLGTAPLTQDRGAGQGGCVENKMRGSGLPSGGHPFSRICQAAMPNIRSMKRFWPTTWPFGNQRI
jgi:hypothetical protein